jgi:hypothetical protein
VLWDALCRRAEGRVLYEDTVIGCGEARQESDNFA